MEVDEAIDKEDKISKNKRATLNQRITSRIWEFDKLDPYQLFKVTHKRHLNLRVQVFYGQDISKGWRSLFVFKPNPYLILHLKGTPNGKKKTPIVKSSQFPQWNVCFQFVVDPLNMRDLHITLMDKKLVHDRKIGTKRIKINKMKLNTEDRFFIEFKEGSKVYIQFSLVRSRTQDLRFSLALSKGEIEFVKQRRMMILKGMQKFLGDSAPKDIREVPVVAIISSGGGIRAVIASSGVYKALHESGLLDCAMYVAGLSGSSWYLTYLYTHPDFPENVGPGDLIPEIRQNIVMDWRRLLTFRNAHIYLKHLLNKASKGQSINFTDLYGHLLGEMLLGKRKDFKLSELKEKLVLGSIPMPLFTCVVAKDDVSARIYQEYIEFSPYEIGLPKYGVFMKTEKFGSKFYVGKIIKHYDESPFHYLIAIWGSAFSILFKRYFEEEKQNWKIIKKTRDPTTEDQQSIKENGKKESNTPLLKEDFGVSELKDALEDLIPENDNSSENSISNLNEDLTGKNDIRMYEENNFNKSNSTESLLKAEKPPRKVSFKNTPSENNLEFHKNKEFRKRRIKVTEDVTLEEFGVDQLDYERNSQHSNLDTEGSFTKYISDDSSLNKHRNRRKTLIQDIRNDTFRRINKASHSMLDSKFWQNLIERMSNIKWIGGTRAGRAGEVFNPLYSLNLMKTYPISPSFNRSNDDNDFKDYGKPMDANKKTICLVDAGLVFNSPFPLLLRPQRAVDVFISFDYSSRPADFHEPFGELLLAEKWATKNNVAFPPIGELVEKFYNEPLREIYVFEHPSDPYCPILIHCIIFNGLFKEYKLPDIKRETSEEFEFADFRIFSDPENPYSSFKYTYTPLQFDRMCKLMEFNTLHGMDTFSKVLKYAVKRKKKLLEG